MKKAYVSNEKSGGYCISIVHNKNTNYYFVKKNKETGEIIRIGKCNKPSNIENPRKIKWIEVPEVIRKMNFRYIYQGPWDPVKFNIYVYNENK